MYRSIDCSYTQSGPGRSRFSYSISASVFEPTPEDIRLEKAIENFARMSMGMSVRPSIGSRASTFAVGEQRGSPSSSGSRVREAPYPGSYAGSVAESTALSRISHDQKRLVFSRGITAPSVVRSANSRRSGQSPFNTGDYQGYERPGALVRYSKPREEVWDDAVSVVPEDSVSQVSSRTPRRRDHERRGRRRRREDEWSTFSKGTAVPGRGYGRGGVQERELYDVDEQGELKYFTRDITPWQ